MPGCARKLYIPLIPFDRRLYSDLVKVLQFELRCLGLGDRLLREARRRTVEIDIIGRPGGVAAGVLRTRGLLLGHVRRIRAKTWLDMLSWLGEV